jgi:hypothetical protein
MTREQTLELENLDLQMQVAHMTIQYCNLKGLTLKSEYATKKAQYEAAAKEPKPSES